MRDSARVMAWTLLSFSLVWALDTWRGAGASATDPSDDFSYSMARAKPGADYGLMSPQLIETIFIDHLDDYPRSRVYALAEHLIGLCRRYRFDPAFILSLIQVESRFRVGIASQRGAVGLMQIMPSTAEYIAERYNLRYGGERSLKDPFTNISIGIAYLAYLRDRYREVSPYFHIAAYNLGPAKLDDLTRNGFTAGRTRLYYENIRRGVPYIRFYRARGLKQAPAPIWDHEALAREENRRAQLRADRQQAGRLATPIRGRVPLRVPGASRGAASTSAPCPVADSRHAS